MNTRSSIAEEKVDVLGKAAMAVRFANLICKGRQGTTESRYDSLRNRYPHIWCEAFSWGFFADLGEVQ
jgi:hypothetical protein